MSLPVHLSSKVKEIPMDPLALANDLQLAYMLSFSPYNVFNQSVSCSPRDSYNSPLSEYNFVDFDQETFNELHSQTRKNYEGRNSTVVKSIRNSFKQFYTRIAAMTYTTALSKQDKDHINSTYTIKIPNNENQYKIDQMKGNNPNEWPKNLLQFHREIMKLPWDAFANEPELSYYDFIGAVRSSIRGLFESKKDGEGLELSKILTKECEVLLGIALRTNNHTFILDQLNFLNEIEFEKILNKKEYSQFLEGLEKMAKEIFEKIPIQEREEYHMPKKLWNQGEGFMIMKKIHFHKQNGLGYFSIATDGSYLYAYISAINGGMFKIGTGRNGTVAGKIYLERQVFFPVGARIDEVNWVFFKGKLYLKTSSREPSIIEVINPETLKSETTIELKCNGLFGHQSLININRTSILLTDGDRLYYLGKELKIVKSSDEKKKEKVEEVKPPVVKEEQEQKNKKVKKKKPNNQEPPPQPIDESVQKIVQFVLYEFDLNQKEPNEEECDDILVQELFSTFNNYFTIKECQKALWLSNNDFMEACQWLVDQGQKERSIKIYYPSDKITICQAQIANNFAEKSLKGSNELSVKEGSLLLVQNINESIWTMDQDEITCYSENGVKIFSKFGKDTHFIGDKVKLETTHIKTVEGKFPRNPEFSIVYDSYNYLFYTFTWPTDGAHYFPTPVLIGSDYKSSAEITYQKRMSVEFRKVETMKDLSKSLLVSMSILENTQCEQNNKVNNWVWYYGQKIIQIGKEINQSEDKKRLGNKRSKLLAKMNKVQEYHDLYKKEKKEFENKGKVVKEIISVPPFSADGSLENLRLIRKIYGQELNQKEIYNFVIIIQNWLENCPNIIPSQTFDFLSEIRNELMQSVTHLAPTVFKQIYKVFISYFSYFFPTVNSQQKFLTSLTPNQIKQFVKEHYCSVVKFKKSILYEITDKELIVQKYDSKNRFEDMFKKNSTLFMSIQQQVDSLGNLLLSKPILGKLNLKQRMEKNERIHEKNDFFSFLERLLIDTDIGIKLFEFIFLEAFRLVIRNRKIGQYMTELQNLFLDTFKLFEKILPKLNLQSCKNISQTILLVLQLYYASVSSFLPNTQIIFSLTKILEGLQRKQIIHLLQNIDELEFEGISQTSQKIYETPHPIERGKSQSFPSLSYPEASIIFTDFDKRCQSDPNHDILTIQMTHQNIPVGNSIHCNDSIFNTNLRLTGKIEAKKPYLIMGNSVTIDFSSSGHAKDAQSFGRFGFKFGMRPIYAGKYKYKKNGVERVETLFRSKNAFEKYVNALKFTTIITSSAIQKLSYLEKEKRSVKNLQQILAGKIFKEGYEQLALNVSNRVEKDDIKYLVDAFFKNEDLKEPDQIIFKKLHQNFYEQKKQEKSKPVEPLIEEIKKPSLWQMEGIPAYIRAYLEQIRNFRGDFIDVFKQARTLAKPVGNYANELRKKSFNEKYQQLWLQGEAILFLTVLKHSGLLHLNLKFSIEYIKENLKAFEEARNGIFNSFMYRMQTVREWRDLINTFRESTMEQEEEKVEKMEEKVTGVSIKKKGKVAKIKFNKPTSYGRAQLLKQKESGKEEQKMQEVKVQDKKKKAKELAESIIRERLSENDMMIKSLCDLKDIKFIPGESYENVTSILTQIEKQTVNEFQSVYIEPIHHLIRSCLFLLKIKSPSTQENIDIADNLMPQGVSRSLSQDNRNVNANKVNLFREWLQNWKKWKDFRKEGKVELKFPVTEIVSFVNSWIPIEKFQREISVRTEQSERRMKFYEYSQMLIKLTASSFLNKYTFGLQISNINGSYRSGLESVPSSKINQLETIYKDYTRILKEQEKKKIKELPLTLKDINKLVREKPKTLFDLIKKISIQLYLIQSENPKINLDIALYYISLKYLSSSYDELVFIASLIVQRTYLCDHSIYQILSLLQKEIGCDSISQKRLRDYLFIERVLFLLKKLELKVRRNIEIEEKTETASVLFYMMFHVEVPLIVRVGLRILKMLGISLKDNIKTPFDFVYKTFTLKKSVIKKDTCEQFKVRNQKGYNNVEIMAHKCYELFHKGENQIKERLKLKDSEQIIEQEVEVDEYNLILNLHQEEDIAWIVQVLYYIEEIEKTLVQIKDWKEYVQKKSKKKQEPQKKQPQQQPQPPQPLLNPESKEKKESKLERILMNIPQNIQHIDQDIEGSLPIAWFYNYGNIFNNQFKKKSKKVPPPNQSLPISSMNQKKGKNPSQQLNQNPAKKPWNCVQFLKIFKKFEELNSKPLEEPKEEESDEIKAEFVKAKNFINRMRKHCLEASILMTQFSQVGYYLFKENISFEKCEQLCSLFTLGGEGKLKPIPCDFKTKDYGARLSPAVAPVLKKSQMKIIYIKSSKYEMYEELTNLPSNLAVRPQNNSSLFYSALNQLQQCRIDQPHLPYEQFPEVDFTDDPQIEFGKELIDSEFFKMKKKHEEVSLKQYPKLRYFLSQGGLESGLQSSTLVPCSDPQLTQQISSFDSVLRKAKQGDILDDPEELINKAMEMMDRKFQKIGCKEDLSQYLLLNCYLKKISKIDLAFISSKLVKKFGEKLYHFSKGYQSSQSIDGYEEQIERLILKLLDNTITNLSMFKMYRHDEHPNPLLNKNILDFISETKIAENQQISEKLKETIESHQYPKSKYLLPIQPPIPEENNLLKYWDKNILPKIYDFVKTTLRPIEIQDFFEQIRMPLRKNDQLEAKKIAYVICDNKLPQGAVLPDSNHNWNSLTIEEVSIGQDVLIKLPKNKSEVSSPLLGSHGQDYRVGQVVFIDLKNSSILVRHRIPEYAIFCFSWVPVNTLEGVERPIAHYSNETIFQELEISLKGNIYNYSKICLTKLAEKVQLNINELIQETIVDLLRENPISGWKDEKEWPLRPVLKKMLKEGNAKIVQELQKKFCPVKSYDIDLYSEEMIKLNKFQNALGLIVSFKKTASLIWYSSIKFYADPYGYKEIDEVYASKSGINEFNPMEFNHPNIYCKYVSSRDSLKPHEQNKYDQKQIPTTIFAVDPIWSVGCYLGNIISEIALQEKNYLSILTRINKVFLKWMEQKPVALLAAELCKLITKIVHRIISICKTKGTKITLEVIGIEEKQLKELIDWINIIQSEEQKEIIVLYSTLLQNLSETVAGMLSYVESMPKLDLPEQIKEMMSMIHMIAEIEKNLKGQANKGIKNSGEKQWERILVVENIPPYVKPQALKEELKRLVQINHGKVLAPQFDIFFSGNNFVLLVDGWDITELVEEEIMEKIQNEEQKQEQNEEGGLLMEWACEACTFSNAPGVAACEICGTAAPASKAEVVYEKIESADVNKAEEKLKEKQRKRFETIKEDIKAYVDKIWQSECSAFEKKVALQKQEEEKMKEEKKKKKGKNIPEKVEEKKEEKPVQPSLIVASGSDIMVKAVIEEFLKKRFNGIPENLQKLAEGETYVDRFKSLMKKGYDLWGDHIYDENPSLLSFELLFQLMNYIQNDLCKGSSSVLSYSEESIRLLSQIPILSQENEEVPINFLVENSPHVKVKYKNLAMQKSYNIRYSWKIIKELNISASKSLQFMNMDLPEKDFKKSDQLQMTNSLGANLKYLRPLIMGAIKLQLFQKIMQKTSVMIDTQDTPKINLQRLKVKEEKSLKSSIISPKERDEYLFTKAHEQLEKMSPIMMRPFKPKGTEPYLSFGVTFKGELVQGEAGPYRQFFTDISNQLHPKSGLGLFIPTPNNLYKIGEGRSKWAINPKANSTYHFSLFECIGLLMGCCIRTGTHISLDLTDFSWKLIADEEIKFSDFDEMDTQFYAQIKQLMSCPSQEAFDAIEGCIGEPIVWSCKSIDGGDIDLIPNGQNERVEYGDCRRYIEEMKRKRIEECILQIKMIKKGLCKMIPEAYLNHISGEELEIMVCGIPKVDVELLKKHTKYAGDLNEESPRIKFFWEMMRELEEQDKLKIIRFCWGQERLPLNSEEFERNNIRFMIKPMLGNRKADISLPKADTCFFNIELPDYSTKAIMREKILLAVNLDSVSINADQIQEPDDNPLMGNVDYEEEEEYGGGGG